MYRCFEKFGAFALTLVCTLATSAQTCVAAPAAGTAVSHPAAPAAAPDKRTQAVTLYNNKDYRGAALLLDEYLTTNNRDPYAAYYAALANQQIGNSGKARTFYKMVYTLAPTSQIGGYAKNILLKLDPSFAASLPDASTAGAHEGGSGSAQTASSMSADTDAVIDPTIPAECRVRFEKDNSNLEVDVYIDGRRIKMDLDTGAPTVCIGKNQLAEIGAPLPSGPAAGESGGSSNAMTQKYWIVRTTVKLGPIERKNCVVKVLEHNSAPPLLGQTFLHGLDYTIDQGAGEIVFRQKAMTAKMGGVRNSVAVPFEFKEGGSRIVVQVEVNGKSGPMMFDTGNTASACTFKSLGEAKNFNLTVPDDASRRRHVGVTGSGSSLCFPVNRMRLGPIDRSNVEVSVNEGVPDGFEMLPLLGQPFWQGYEYTIDMKKKLIYFVRR